MQSRLPPDSTPASRAVPWALFVLVAVAVAMGLSFSDTGRAVVTVWNSDSFAHGWIIAPISLWLVWQRRAELARCSVRPFWPATLGLFACGAAWLFGRLAGVNALEQFALVGMFQCAVALCFGWAVIRIVAFPLLFLFFGVPFGEFLLPPLMEMTANFTVAAIRMTGIPIVREGLHFELPSGRWSVVEACSGLRYLLAALPIAFIYAYLSFRSLKVRTMFVATVLLVAVVANWLRAYMIVMLGHLSGMKIAVGVDHIIYGWVFFGVVMALSFWVGSFWEDPPDFARQDNPGPTPGATPVRSPSERISPAAWIGALATGLAGVAIWPFCANALFDVGLPTVRLAALAPAIEPEPLPQGTAQYHPLYQGGVGHVFGRARSDPEVGIFVAHYVRQHANGEMLTWGNRVVPGDPEDLSWRVVSRTELSTANPGPTNEYTVQGPKDRFLVWEWFSVNGRRMTDSRRIKLQTAFDLLRGRGDESVAWFVWTPLDADVGSARSRLERAAASLENVARLAGTP